MWCGLKGIIKIRDLPSGKCVKEFGSINVIDQGESSEGITPPGYTQLLYHNQLDSVIAVTVDHNIIIYGLPELETKKQVDYFGMIICALPSTQLIGYNDEILDVALVGNDNSHVAVATNSEQVRVFNRHTLNCQLLSGHSGMY